MEGFILGSFKFYYSSKTPPLSDRYANWFQIFILFLRVVVQSLASVQLFVTPWAAACQASLSFIISGAFSNSYPLSWWWHQSIRASVSTSVLPLNIQDWFLLGLTGLVSLQSMALLSVFSDTTVQKHQFFLYSPTLTSIYDYWKIQTFDYTNLCQQSSGSAF